MPVYFKEFPKLQYGFRPDLDKTMTMVNILRRFRPVREVLERAVIYYTYDIKDGERPDIVSHKIYETVDYDWIILMFNMRFDPYYSWPLSYEEFNTFLKKKYGSVESSTQTIHHYEQIIQAKSVQWNGNVIPERSLVIDSTVYAQLPADQRRIVYCYDYENDRNEKRRTIKLVDSTYIPQILEVKKKILS
jgi:hypothetical protein